jgi:hypothetical protein
MLLTEVANKTSILFEKELKVPEPPVIWKDKLAALEEAKLDKQKDALLFDMRCWQADEMGFQRMDSGELVKMLMGESHTEAFDSPDRQIYEWVYVHHNDSIDKDSGWGGKPTRFVRVDNKGFWYLPPFAKIKLWECQFGKLDYLKREIPYGVVLVINETKKLKLFNVFHAIAPMEAWEKKTDIDPIVVASIWELPEYLKSEQGARKAGQVAHYFIAKW